jgi:outer membrane protein TolC
LQDALFEEALLGYNKAVLRAVSDVSNALNGYMYTKEQLLQNEYALKATVRAFNLSARQYNDGLVSYQRLLSTVEKLTLIQDAYAQIKGLVSLNAILLYKALGGGWQNSLHQAYIDENSLQRLRKSGIDWGEYLDDVRFGNE